MISGVLREDAPVREENTNRGEKAATERERSEESGHERTPKFDPREKLSEYERLGFFNLIMFVPAALIWYAFCSQSNAPLLPPRNTAPHITDPRLLKLLLDGWEFV